jgi:hypothetical protein
VPTKRRNPSRLGPVNKSVPPSNQVAPVVPIVLDKPRTMKYDFYALSRLEDETGYSVLDEKTWENMKIKDVVKFLWAGLLHEEHDLEIDDVARMVHFNNIRYVMDAINQTFHTSLPSPDGVQASVGEGGDPTNGPSQIG